MIIKCGECGSAFELDQNQIGKKGSKVRCSVCKLVFMVYSPSSPGPPSGSLKPVASSVPVQIAVAPPAVRQASPTITEMAYENEDHFAPEETLAMTDDADSDTEPWGDSESGEQPGIPDRDAMEAQETGMPEPDDLDLGPESTMAMTDDADSDTEPWGDSESGEQPGIPDRDAMEAQETGMPEPDDLDLGPESTMAMTDDADSDTEPWDENETEISDDDIVDLAAIGNDDEFGPEATIAMTDDTDSEAEPGDENETAILESDDDIVDLAAIGNDDEFGPEATIAMTDDTYPGRGPWEENGTEVLESDDDDIVDLAAIGNDDEFGPEETIAIGGDAYPETAPQDALDQKAAEIFRDSFADASPKDEWSMDESPGKEYVPKKRIKKFKPFRTKLIRFATIIIGVIAVIVIPIESYRPMERLHQLIENAKNLVGGLEAAFHASDIEKMNRFALKTLYLDLKKAELSSTGENHRKLRYDTYQLERLLREKEIFPETKKILGQMEGFPGRDETDERYYRALSFNMLLIEGKILPEKVIMETIDSGYVGEFADGFVYSRLLRSAAYWQAMFESAPGIFDILSKYKRIVMNAKTNSEAAGFSIAEIYIMMDTGKKEGFFENNITYVLDSISWSENGTSVCEPYEITNNGFWRKLALAGENGFGNNPLADPILPRFDKDEYGTWFGVWYTRQTNGIFNTFSIDFNASGVKKLMLMVCVLVLGVGLVLVLIVYVITKWLSSLITRPITELIKGADQVSQGNYDYVVPIIKEDEFGDLTKQFNRMTNGQRERLNLMETLEKLLSKDLAQKAAQSGLVIGGQRADCTVMFTDFAGFSTITQQMNATEAVNILNAYFSGLIPILKKYGGFPDKYIGDAIVGLFGAPVRVEDHAERAVACAIEMQWKMREMNEQRRKQGRTVFEMRIGLNSGEVLVGAIGCDLKLEYTSIGETTNLANRMEAICEIGHVMIAEGTYREIKNTFFERVDIERTPRKVQVKGYPEPVSCYCVHIDNLKIEKDLLSDGPIKSFYVYTDGGYEIKSKPEDIPEINFTSVAKYRYYTEE